MHAEAKRGQRGVVIYLLPGLTSAQRAAALRRLRQEGSRGCGPPLPAGRLAVALTADRMRAGAGHTAAAVRHHPVGTILPALLAGGLLAGFVLASASVRGEPAPVSGTSGAASWSVPAGTAVGQFPAGTRFPAGSAAVTRLPARTQASAAVPDPAGTQEHGGPPAGATSTALPDSPETATRQAPPASPQPSRSSGPGAQATPHPSQTRCAPAPEPGAPAR